MNRKALFRMTALAATIGAGFVGGAATAQEPPRAAPLENAPSITVDQVVARAGNALEFAEVRMDQPGFIVLHEGLNGQPASAASLTHVFVGTGVHGNVLVPLEGGYENGKEYILSLHYDSNNNGTYDHESDPSVDGPIVRADGTLYAIPFVTQPGG